MPMAFTKCYIMRELFGTVLVLSALFSTTSAVDCYGKSFRCVNSTHFMICVDFGGGVSQAIEDFYIACPPPTVCQGNNHFECEFPAPKTPDTTLNNVVNETTLPWEEIVTVSSLNNTAKEFSENYMDTTIERGTTTTIEYSVTTDTTVDVTSNTAPDVYINNELNVTEVAATIAAETKTAPVEIIPQTLSEVTLVTQTTENIQIADIQSEAQSTADTTNLTQTKTVVAGKEIMISDLNNTQTTTENKVITETVTEQIAPTEQIIQTTTNDPPEQEPAYLYTDLQPVINLRQNESLTNNTVTEVAATIATETTTTPLEIIPQILSEVTLVTQTTENIQIADIQSEAQSTADTRNLTQTQIVVAGKESIISDLSNTQTTTENEVIIETVTEQIAPTEQIIQTTTNDPPEQEPAYLYTDLQPVITLLQNESLTNNTVTEVAATIATETTTTPLEIIPQILSEVTLVTQTTENIKIADIQSEAQSTADTTNLTQTQTVVAGKEIMISDINNTQTTTENKVITETVTEQIAPTEQIIQTTTNDPPEQEPAYLYTDLQPVINLRQNESLTNNTVTEVAATIATETTTTPLEIIPQILSEVTLVTQTTENIQIADIQSEAQSTADTTNLTQTQTVVAGKEIMISDINNTQTTTENKVITETVTEQIAPTEQIIQTTTNDPPEQEPAYLYTDLQPVINLRPNESLTNNTLLIESSVANEYIQATEKPFLTLDIGTKNNQDLFPISEKANVLQNVEITFTVESIVESTTASIEHLISIANYDISTEVYHGSTAPSLDIKLKPYHSGLRENAPASTKLEGKIESKVTSDKEQNKESQMDKIKHAVDETKPTIGEWVLATNTENLSTRPFDIFTELAVTTDLPFANDPKANAINTTDTNYIDNKPIPFTNAPNSERTTTLDGIFAIETFENGSSSDLPTTINEGQLTKESTQNVATINLEILTTETEYTTISNSNFQSVTTQAPIVITKSHNSVDSELGGEFIIENVERTASTEQPTTINQPSLTIGTSKNVVIENKLISTSKAINQSFVSTTAIKKPIKVINVEPMMTEVPSIVTNIQSVENTKLDPALVTKETVVTDTPVIIATQPIVTEGPDTKSQRPNTSNIVYNELDGRFITENVENTASTEQPTTVYEQSLTVDPRQNVVVKNDIISTNKKYQDISMSGYEPITIINLHTTMTEAPSLMTKKLNIEDQKLDSASIVQFDTSTEQTKTINEETRATITPNIVNAKPMITEVPSLGTKTQNLADKNLDSASIVEFGTSTEQTKTINEETWATNTPDIVNAKPMMTGVIITKTQNSAGTKLGGAFINKTTENIGSMKNSNTINEQSLTMDTTKTNVEYIIFPTSEALNRGIMSTESIHEPSTIINLETMITEAPTLVTKTQNSENTKEDAAFIIKDIKFGGNTDQFGTTDTSATVATKNNNIPIKLTVHTVINNTQPPITEASLLTTTVQNPIKNQYLTTNTQIEENGAIAVKPILINKEISTTNTEQTFAPETIITPTRRDNLDITTMETLYTLTTAIDDHLIPVAAEHMSNKDKLIMTQRPTNVTITDRVLNLESVSSSAGTIQATVTNEKSPSGQNVKINDNTILNSALPNEKGHLKASAINIDHNDYANQDNFKIGTTLSNQISSGINVPENLPSLHITHGISMQNGNNIDLSTSQGPEKESNDISNRAFMSQQGNSERILVTNDAQFSTVQPNIIEHNNQVDNINLNPLGSYLIDKSNQNPESARKSSVINLNVEENSVDTALPDIAFVSQRPFKSTLAPASSSISVRHNNREQSTTGMQTSVQNSINGLMQNITKVNSEPEIDTLPAPESKMIAKEDSVNVKTSGGLAVVSTTVPTRATVAYTTMLDSIQNAYETITAFFRPGSKSTADETGNNFGELGSNANVFQDKTESEHPKNSKDPIPTSQSVTYQYQLTTNGQDVPETTSTRISTKGNIINETVNAPRNTVMLDVLPLPINNVGLRAPVTNTPVVTDLTTKAQNESYKSVTFNPALTNTGTHAGINGVDITIAPTLRNPSLKLQAGVTDKGNASPKNPLLGDSAIVGYLAKNNDDTIFSTLSDATSNLPTEVINRADISSQQPQQIELGHVEKTIATDYAYIQLFSEQRENKNIQNVLGPIPTDNMAIGVTPERVPDPKNQIPKSIVNTVEDQKTNSTVITDLKYNSLNGSETKSEPQQNNSPKNHTLSTQTQKTYGSSTVRAPSQSVTQKPIHRTKNITKPVTNDPIAFNCIKGIRGRYSDKDDCRKFYICLGVNRPIVGNCPENTVFSDVKKLCTKNLSHCIRQNEFKCPSAGRFSDFLKDNVYYICVSHKSHLYKFKFQCQKGYILNKTIVKCIEANEIESNESVSISSSDSSRQTSSAGTVSSSTNSNSISSSKMSNTSNGGDSSSSKSEDSLKNKKSNEPEETPEQPEGNEKITKEDDEDDDNDDDDEVFKCKKEGKFPIRHECRRYYLCKKKRSQFRRKIKKCESGSLFHKDKKKCVDADDYECN